MLIKGQPGTRIELAVMFEVGRKHLPVITLRRVARNISGFACHGSPRSRCAIRPDFHPPVGIVSAPKVYAFDTGVSCHYRGWHQLRREDLGTLWEHFVLNEVMANAQTRQVFYWRDKRGHEVDLVWVPRGAKPLAVECKWSADEFEVAGIAALRRQYRSSVPG